MSQLSRAFFICRKDVESYYSKPPLVTWGLLFPAVLILATFIKEPGAHLGLAPGIIALTLLFGSTSMAAIVVTWEKRSGTMKRLLLAPLTHRTIILGKALSATGYGLATSLALTLGLAAVLGLRVADPVLFLLALAGGGLTFSLLGLLASVMVREVFEAMTLMNFFRFPILFLSGVFMPLEEFPAWLKPVALASPLTHLVELLRLASSGQGWFASPLIPGLGLACYLVLAWALAGPVFRRGANL